MKISGMVSYSRKMDPRSYGDISLREDLVARVVDKWHRKYSQYFVNTPNVILNYEDTLVIITVGYRDVEQRVVTQIVFELEQMMKPHVIE